MNEVLIFSSQSVSVTQGVLFLSLLILMDKDNILARVHYNGMKE